MFEKMVYIMKVGRDTLTERYPKLIYSPVVKPIITYEIIGWSVFYDITLYTIANKSKLCDLRRTKKMNQNYIQRKSSIDVRMCLNIDDLYPKTIAIKKKKKIYFCLIGSIQGVLRTTV